MTHKAAAILTTRIDALRRREAGQGTLEYIGMAIVAALVIVAVMEVVGEGDVFGQAFQNAIDDVFNR